MLIDCFFSISDGSSHGGSTSGGSNRPPPGGPSRGGFTSGGPPNGHKSNRPIFPIVCYAHKNGCLDNAMRLVAPDIPQVHVCFRFMQLFVYCQCMINTFLSAPIKEKQ